MIHSQSLVCDCSQPRAAKPQLNLFKPKSLLESHLCKSVFKSSRTWNLMSLDNCSIENDLLREEECQQDS